LDVRRRKWRDAEETVILANFICTAVNNEIKENEMGGVSSTHGDMRNAFRILVGKPERRKT
jgi:hypothetical protein